MKVKEVGNTIGQHAGQTASQLVADNLGGRLHAPANHSLGSTRTRDDGSAGTSCFNRVDTCTDSTARQQ